MDRACSQARIVGCVVLIAAGMLRLAAAQGDLQIDEIWTWLMLRTGIKNVAQIFLLRHDNNHLFNTIVMYVLGTTCPAIWYRLPAVAAAVGSVWLAGKAAAREGGRPAQVIAWLLFGTSYLQVIYGSEARGYAYVVFFAFWAWNALRRLGDSYQPRDAILFAVGCCLGFLSHLTFVYAYGGFCVWTLWTWLRKPAQVLIWAHVVPVLMAVCLQLFFIRGMAIGGGPESTILDAVISTLSLMLGGPIGGEAAFFVSIFSLILLSVGFYGTWNKAPAIAASEIMIIILGPAMVLLITGHALIYPRYFLIPVSFAMLVIAQGFAGWWQTGRTGQIATVVVLTGFLVGNGWWNACLLDHGRGDYTGALRWLAQQVPTGPIVLSSDHDFRNGILLEYYAQKTETGPLRFQYVPQNALPPTGTPWLILHSFAGNPQPPEFISDRHQNSYQLQRGFRHQSLSGWHWWIYRRVERAPTAS